MELSSEQSKAVKTDSKKALVLAGAGSGKTRVLISRIQHLIENEKVSPYEILSFTFTRKAAGEMKKRLETEIGSQAYKITMGTMHGVALNYLQRFGELVGLRPEKITVYSSWEEQFLLKEVAKDLGYHNGRAWKKVKKGDVDAAFNIFYTTGAWGADNEHENALMEAFFARCHENNALTYGTILTTFLRLLPQITQFLNLRHIMIDEVQDNDPLQWEIVNRLCRQCNTSLFAVGDIRQSIFSFRGADPEYLIRNQGQFDVYNLQDNYRSLPDIVEAANKLIDHNQLNMGEPMAAIRRERLPISTIQDVDSTSIQQWMINNDLGKTAILARNHFMLKKLSRLLAESYITHEYIGKESGLVRSEEFRRFHAFLKLIVNPFDNFSFLLIKEYLELSSEDYGSLRLDALTEGKSHYQTWNNYYYKMELKELWWFNHPKDYCFSDIIDRMKDINFDFDTEPIFNFIYSWIIENPAGTINQYLNWLATFDVSDEMKKEPENLQLMTIHASKGLEWPTVIVAGLNEGIFPSTQSIKKNELEDETRLCYVALTRSKDQLILTSRPVKKDEDGNITNKPSRFIKWALK